MKSHSVVVFFALYVLFATGSYAQKISLPQDESLKRFLQNYDGNPSAVDERTTRYSAALVHLHGDGTQQVIVYLIGPRWCGSGGCTMLVLVPHGSSYAVVTRATITQRPVRVLSTKTNGWHDLGVWVQGGGIQPGYEAKLEFNGKKYPSNPSVPRARPLRNRAAGKVVIPSRTEGKPLYGDKQNVKRGANPITSSETPFICNFARVYNLKNGGHLLVRSGPGLQFSKVGQLKNGKSVYICDERGEWVKVFYGGAAETPCTSVSSGGLDVRQTAACKSGWVNPKWIDVLSG